MDLLVFWFMATVFHPVIGHHWEESGTNFLAPAFELYLSINEIPSCSSRLQTKQVQLLQSLLKRDSLLPSWPSSGSFPVAPCFSWTVETIIEHSTPAVVSLGQSRGGWSPPLTCWPHSSWCTPGYHWFAWTQRHTASSIFIAWVISNFHFYYSGNSLYLQMLPPHYTPAFQITFMNILNGTGFCTSLCGTSLISFPLLWKLSWNLPFDFFFMVFILAAHCSDVAHCGITLGSLEENKRNNVKKKLFFLVFSQWIPVQNIFLQLSSSAEVNNQCNWKWKITAMKLQTLTI